MKIKFNKIILIIFALAFVVGILGLRLPFSRGLMLSLTPLFLLVSSSFVFFKEFITSKNLKFLMWIAFCFTFGLIVEIVGVNTGFIFGSYTYGDSLGFKILNTPFIIGINWITVATGTYYITQRLPFRIFASIVAAVIAVVFDIFLEFVAINLNFWSWGVNKFEVPVQNFVAWALITLLMVYVGRTFKIELKSRLTLYFFLMQAVFFVILNLLFRF